jgi:hypothetical protein
MFSLIQFEWVEGCIEWIMESIEKYEGRGVSLWEIHCVLCFEGFEI